MSLSIAEIVVTDLFARENDKARKVAADKESCDKLSHIFSKRVKSLMKGMKTLLKNADTFDVENIVELTVNTVMRKIGRNTSTEHIHWAPTQSGKTAFKAVKICSFLTMNIPVILLTKGKKESEELYGKICSYLQGSRFESSVLSVYQSEDLIWNEFLCYEKASVLIIPDTFQQIAKTKEILDESLNEANNNGFCCAGCALILDEADAVTHRSEDNVQKNEIALNKFLQHFDPLVVKVTATPIPTFEHSIDKKPIVTTSKKKLKNYVGVENQVNDHLDLSVKEGFMLDLEKFVLEKEPGKRYKPKFEFEEIRKRSRQRFALFPFKEDSKAADKPLNRTKFPSVWNKTIPFFNNQCIKLLRQEILKKNSVGMLTLVDTCPWVTKEKKNVFLQASGVQDYFYTIPERKFIAIVVHAEFVFYRLPGHKFAFQCHRTLGELIEKIDNSKTYGLKMPIVIFGYYAMKRSRSFRSTKRVPTSMILNLGKGQSNESVRQAGGRPTFKGLDVLKRNRKTDKIRMLCPMEDFEIIQKYDPLVLDIIDLYRERHLSWNKIESELCRTSPNYFLSYSARRTGNYEKSEVSSKWKKKRRVSFESNCNSSSNNNNTCSSTGGGNLESNEGQGKNRDEVTGQHSDSSRKPCPPPQKAAPTNNPSGCIIERLTGRGSASSISVDSGEDSDRTIPLEMSTDNAILSGFPPIPDFVTTVSTVTPPKASGTLQTAVLPQKRESPSEEATEETTVLATPYSSKKRWKQEDDRLVDLIQGDGEDAVIDLACGDEEEEAIDLTDC
ncbi:unnamed protein product [Pseudo-nitzschia multistriata]|uniref:Uncharacterized protein n=1 Tax=Pseudo-nitzschia multistriata TaxID=183589 RepID=A0A448ZQP8_9STRA|nr:unnamed protein product [Pseudo-nitzschia multistriata]